MGSWGNLRTILSHDGSLMGVHYSLIWTLLSSCILCFSLRCLFILSGHSSGNPPSKKGKINGATGQGVDLHHFPGLTQNQIYTPPFAQK